MDFKLQGTNGDGGPDAAWTTVAEIEGETGWTVAEDRTYLVPEAEGDADAGPFTRYRLLVRRALYVPHHHQLR